MIYVIHAEGTDFYKVGKSDGNGKLRIATLQTGCPHSLKLMAIADWPDSIEFRIHAFLTRKETHVRGEWFRASEHLSALISAMECGDIENWLNYLRRISLAPKRLTRVMALAA